jgi:hypothetical protein
MTLLEAHVCPVCLGTGQVHVMSTASGMLMGSTQSTTPTRACGACQQGFVFRQVQVAELLPALLQALPSLLASSPHLRGLFLDAVVSATEGRMTAETPVPGPAWKGQIG